MKPFLLKVNLVRSEDVPMNERPFDFDAEFKIYNKIAFVDGKAQYCSPAQTFGICDGVGAYWINSSNDGRRALFNLADKFGNIIATNDFNADLIECRSFGYYFAFEDLKNNPKLYITVYGGRYTSEEVSNSPVDLINGLANDYISFAKGELKLEEIPDEYFKDASFAKAIASEIRSRAVFAKTQIGDWEQSQLAIVDEKIKNVQNLAENSID